MDSEKSHPMIANVEVISGSYSQMPPFGNEVNVCVS